MQAAIEPTETETTNSRKHITRQWVDFDVFQALEKTEQQRPDFEVRVLAVERNDNMILAQMTFTNVGKTVFMRRLINFVILAMKDNYKR